MDNLSEIEREDAELRAQLEAINAKRLELQRARMEAMRNTELTREQIINVLSVDVNSVSLKVMNPIGVSVRADLLNVLRSIRSRAFNYSTDVNVIACGDYDEFVAKCSALPNVKINISVENADKIEYRLRAPLFSVNIDGKHLIVTPGPSANAAIIRNEIPGSKYNDNKRAFEIPLSEGWRLAESLSNFGDKVVWTEAAQKFVINQVEQRASLDIIAKLSEAPEIDPKFINGAKLRPFQQVDVKFALATGGNLLIANQVGLGKTVEALAIARMLAMQSAELGNNKMFRTLVIAPAHLKTNWLREIKKYTGVSPAVMMGREPTQHDMLSLLAKEDQREFTVINYHSIRAAAQVRRDLKDQEGYTHRTDEEKFFWVDLLNMAKFDLIIIDEAHYIKDVDAQQSKAVRMIKAPRIVELTATPVMNRPREFWPMLHIINPTLFPSQEEFVKNYTYDGKNAKNVAELHAITKSMMIRRLKKDVQKDLPPIVPNHQYHKLSDKAQKIYDKVMKGIYEDVTQDGMEKAITNILVQIQRCKQVCAIDMMDATATLANELYDGSEGDSHRKVLIFSQYEMSVKGIAGRLREDGCLYIMGSEHSPEERMRIVDRFQNDPSIKYLVASSKAAGEGLNITAAGNIILHDLMWTPAAHDQLIGRAYGRESDLHGVNVYYMIAEDTIMEWIMDLLEEKMAMINEVVEGIESSRDGSVAMALINKIRESMYTKGSK